jgi:cytoskeleton protein RodZ
MSQAIGQQLRQAREARSITLEQAAQATHLRIYYLEALESGDLSALPSIAQGRGFLRSYAGFLNLDAAALLARLSDEVLPDLQVVRVDEKPPAPQQAPSLEIHEELPASADLEQADAVFMRLGQNLQQRRELLGLTLEDVEKHIRLRKNFIQALEAGNMSELPSPVQCRGMLKNYAVFMGMDADEVLLRFAEGLQSRFIARAESTRKQTGQAQPRQTLLPRRPIRSGLKRLFSIDILVSGALVIFLAVFVVWAAVRILEARSVSTPTSSAPSIAEVLLASPTASITLTPGLVTPLGPPSTLVLPTLAPGGNVLAQGTAIPVSQDAIRINITVRQRAWMRVLVDGKVEFDGRVIPGSAYSFVGEEQVEVQTGNAAALQIFFNQQDLGSLGVFGQVILRIFSRQGIITPTVTITLTPTATLPPTATPTPTRTTRIITPTRPSIP